MLFDSIMTHTYTHSKFCLSSQQLNWSYSISKNIRSYIVAPMPQQHPKENLHS